MHVSLIWFSGSNHEVVHRTCGLCRVWIAIIYVLAGQSQGTFITRQWASHAHKDSSGTLQRLLEWFSRFSHTPTYCTLSIYRFVFRSESRLLPLAWGGRCNSHMYVVLWGSRLYIFSLPLDGTYIKHPSFFPLRTSLLLCYYQGREPYISHIQQATSHILSLCYGHY